MFRVSTLVSSFKFQISSHTEITDSTETVFVLPLFYLSSISPSTHALDFAAWLVQEPLIFLPAPIVLPSSNIRPTSVQHPCNLRHTDTTDSTEKVAGKHPTDSYPFYYRGLENSQFRKLTLLPVIIDDV